LALEQFAEESLGRLAVTRNLEQDIEDVAVLVDSAPQVLSLTSNGYEHFNQEPLIARSRLPSPQVTSVLRTEAVTPSSDGFVAHRNPAVSEQLFDFTKAEREPVVQKHSM
jgi:hypothetical protein